METAQLEYFVAVAKTGKITSAANELFVTPPAISISLSQLEKELGVQLFTRKSNRLLLNKQGEIFLDYAESILDSMREVRAQIRESFTCDRQQISVAVTSSDIWTDVMAAFYMQHPECTLSSVKMVPSDLMSGTFHNQFSFLLASDEDVSPRCICGCRNVHLFDDMPAVAVHEKHPFARKISVAISEVIKEKLIWARPGPKVCDFFYELFRRNSVNIPAISDYNLYICQTLVSQNEAVMLTTMHAKNGSADDLQFVPIETDDFCRAQYLYWREDRELSPAEETFLDFVTNYYRK